MLALRCWSNSKPWCVIRMRCVRVLNGHPYRWSYIDHHPGIPQWRNAKVNLGYPPGDNAKPIDVHKQTSSYEHRERSRLCGGVFIVKVLVNHHRRHQHQDDVVLEVNGRGKMLRDRSTGLTLNLRRGWGVNVIARELLKHTLCEVKRMFLLLYNNDH